MSRNPSALQVLVAVAALAVVAAAIAWLPSDGSDLPEALEISAADASEVAVFNAANGGGDADPATTGAAPAAAAPVAAQPVALPATQDGTAAPAPAAPTDTAAPAAPAPTDTAAPAPTDTAPADPAPADPAPAPAPQPERDNNDGGGNGGYISRAAQEGYDVHDFVEHTVELLGTRAMEPGQSRTGGFERVGPYEIRAWSPITGQRPVIEQAIDDVRERNPEATGQDLERRVAKRLTELNDWKNLNRQTQENMMIVTGVDIADMNKRQREDTINHLLHSPLPFGYIDEVLSPDTTIDMGYTHTLDKDWTEAAHLGDGVFQILMISNNNNGSHTGHVLGSFKVQLTPTTTLAQARDIGNDMVQNRNKNNKLYLAEAARRVLYGETPRLDFSGLSEEERRAIYDGRGLGNPGPLPVDPTATTQPPEPTTTAPTTPEETVPSTTPEETVPTTPAEETTTTIAAEDPPAEETPPPEAAPPAPSEDPPDQTGG